MGVFDGICKAVCLGFVSFVVLSCFFASCQVMLAPPMAATALRDGKTLFVPFILVMVMAMSKILHVALS